MVIINNDIVFAFRASGRLEETVEKIRRADGRRVRPPPGSISLEAAAGPGTYYEEGTAADHLHDASRLRCPPPPPLMSSTVASLDDRVYDGGGGGGGGRCDAVEVTFLSLAVDAASAAGFVPSSPHLRHRHRHRRRRRRRRRRHGVYRTTRCRRRRRQRSLRRYGEKYK